MIWSIRGPPVIVSRVNCQLIRIWVVPKRIAGPDLDRFTIIGQNAVSNEVITRDECDSIRVIFDDRISDMNIVARSADPIPVTGNGTSRDRTIPIGRNAIGIRLRGNERTIQHGITYPVDANTGIEEFGRSGPVSIVMAEYGYTGEKIAAKAKELLG